jgi:hypothetical protein
MATDNATGGYWFVATDGGIFAFNAPFYGSAVAPPPPPPPPPPPSGTPACSVVISNQNPLQYTEETATIASNVLSAAVTMKLYYKTTTTVDTGTTDFAGSASIPFYISGATIGYQVLVSVNVGGANCSTNFTPA